MAEAETYSDKELLKIIRTNNDEGWERVHAHFDPMIQSIVSWPKWNFSDQEKQDVAQNIYIQLQRALPTFRQQSSLMWFMKKIATRQCINEIRQQVRWRTLITPSTLKTSDGDWIEVDYENPESLNPLDQIMLRERRSALEQSIYSLKDTCKKPITFFYVEEMTYKEISEELCIEVNTVGSRLSKCLDKLHKDLRQHPLFKRSV